MLSDTHVIRGLTAQFNHQRVKVDHLDMFFLANLHIQMILNMEEEVEISTFVMLSIMLLTPNWFIFRVYLHLDRHITHKVMSKYPSRKYSLGYVISEQLRKKPDVCQYIWFVHSVLKWQKHNIPGVVFVINVNKIQNTALTKMNLYLISTVNK